MKWIRLFWTRVRCECPTKVDLGMDGEAHAVMVSNSAKDSESEEDHPHGAVAGGDCGY